MRDFIRTRQRIRAKKGRRTKILSSVERAIFLEKVKKTVDYVFAKYDNVRTLPTNIKQG